jgi:hypothetical protein
MQKCLGLQRVRQLTVSLGITLMLVLMLIVGSVSEATAQGDDSPEELDACVKKAKAEMAAAKTFNEEVTATKKFQDCLSTTLSIPEEA